MAEKTLKTRIQLKYDTFERWNTNNPILKAGEFAVTVIPTTTEDGSSSTPVIMLKVGDDKETAWKSLPWASGLAADVYAWAKAETKPTYDYSELTGTPTIPTVGNGQITIMQGSTTKGTFTVNQANDQTIELTDNDTNTQYQLVLSDHTLKLQSRELTNGVWGKWEDVKDQSFTLPDTTYTFSTGSDDAEAEDGTFTVTPKDGSAQRVKIKNVVTTSGAVFTGPVTVLTPTADMNPATKQYVDSAIEGVSQFNYEVVTELLTASADTMGTIYLKAHVHDTESEVESGTSDTYDEYLTIRSGSEGSYTYSWEKIGNTDIDLDEYVNTVETTGTASGLITTITKSGNTITATRASLQVNDVDASGYSYDFVSAVTQGAEGRISATKKSIPTMTAASAAASGDKGLVPAPAIGDQTKFLRGDGTWAVPTDAKVNVTANATAKAYLLATTTTPSSTAAAVTSIADSGVYLGTTAGQLVATEFKGKLIGNADSATQLKTSRAIDGVNFNGTEDIIHYGDCSTAAATAAKTVACTGFTLVTGARIAVKFTVSNTASNPTLNVTGTGAKAIYYRGSAIPSAYLAAGRTYEFIYNGSQYELVGDIDTDTHYTAHLKVGASSTAQTDGAATNGNVYLNLTENGIVRDYHNIKGTGATTVTSDANGVITVYSTDNDTKNTAGSTNTSSKIFLVGATSQASNPQTYSHDTAYVGTDGCLYSNSSKVATLEDNNSFSGLNTFKKTSDDQNTDYLIKLDNSSTTPNIVLGSAPKGSTDPTTYTKYTQDGITKVSAAGTLNLSFPGESGTLALTKDIVDTKNTTGSSSTTELMYLVGAPGQALVSVTYSKSGLYADSQDRLNNIYRNASTSTQNTVRLDPKSGHVLVGMGGIGVDPTMYAKYGNSGIVFKSGGADIYTLNFPSKSGTLATTDDITAATPDLSNYVTLTTQQQITGKKTFKGDVSFEGTSNKSAYFQKGFGIHKDATINISDLYTVNVPNSGGRLLTGLTTTENGGLKIDTTIESKPKVDIDDSVTFILDCGDSTVAASA